MVLQHVLAEIPEALSTISKCSMSQFGLQTSQKNLQPLAAFQQQLTPDQLENESMQQFNSYQQQVFNETINSVLPGVCINILDYHATKTHIHSLKDLFFFIALEDTENTFLTTATESFLDSKRKRVLKETSSTVAAQLFDGGHTAHSALKISILFTWKAQAKLMQIRSLLMTFSKPISSFATR